MTQKASTGRPREACGDRAACPGDPALKVWHILPRALEAWRALAVVPYSTSEDAELALLTLLAAAQPTSERTPAGWEVWLVGREQLRVEIERHPHVLLVRSVGAEAAAAEAPPSRYTRARVQPEVIRLRARPK
jgi:hypothetical protein